jgi:hypothetical protein
MLLCIAHQEWKHVDSLRDVEDMCASLGYEWAVLVLEEYVVHRLNANDVRLPMAK